MTSIVYSWAAQQLTEFLTLMDTCADVPGALRAGVQRAAEAFEAEAGVAVSGGAVVASVGFPACAPHDPRWGEPGTRSAAVPGLGTVPAVGAPLDDGWLALARQGEPFTVEETALLRGMARAL